MKSKINFLTLLLTLLCICSCSSEPKLEVKYLDKSSIEVSNIGDIEVTGIRLIIDRYFTDIESLPIGEKIVVFPKDFLKFETNEPYDKEYFNSDITVFANTKKEERSNLFTCKYTPICEDPSGLYFIGDSNYNIRFYKYSNQGKFIVTTKDGYGTDTANILSDGKFSLDKENNKLVLETYGNIIWEGIYDGISLELKRITEISNTWVTSQLSLTPYYGTPIEKNLTAEERNIDYESAVLLSISQNFSFEDAVIEYAKIYRSEDYNKYHNDEFTWHDLYPQIKQEYQNKIENLNNKFSMRFEWNLGDYNFDTESFDISFVVTDRRDNQEYVSLIDSRVYNEIENNNAVSLAYLEKNYNLMNTSLTLCIEGTSLFGPISKPIQFDIPMKKNEAQEFLNNRKNASGETDKSVFVIVYYEVPKNDPSNSWEKAINETYQAFGISNKNTLIGKFYKIEVYDSKENMNRLRKAELTQKN